MERRGAHTVIHSTETLSTPRGRTTAKTGVEGIANRACRQPEATFTTLMHHLSVDNLRACFEVLDGKKALGVDGVSKEAYGQNLEANLQELHRKLHQMSYRPQPVRQVEIPKEDGTMRSLGISCTEDKIVQEMTRRILDAIYEPGFIETSGMSRMLCKQVNVIVGSDLGTQLQNETEQPANLESAWCISWQYS